MGASADTANVDYRLSKTDFRLFAANGKFYIRTVYYRFMKNIKPKTEDQAIFLN